MADGAMSVDDDVARGQENLRAYLDGLKGRTYQGKTDEARAAYDEGTSHRQNQGWCRAFDAAMDGDLGATLGLTFGALRG
jgi:hypothetical protein